MLISRGTVVVTYRTVSVTSTISSSTDNISAPLLVCSSRKNAKLVDIIIIIKCAEQFRDLLRSDNI